MEFFLACREFLRWNLATAAVLLKFCVLAHRSKDDSIRETQLLHIALSVEAAGAHGSNKSIFNSEKNTGKETVK